MDSLEAVAAELRAAKPAMLAFVPQAEHHIVEAFFSRTVQASGGPLCRLVEPAHFCGLCGLQAVGFQAGHGPAGHWLSQGGMHQG